MTLTVNRLHFGYQHKAIFKEISLSIPQGKLVGIVGPNGGGKSTLLKLLAGQEQPQSGEILLKGKPLGSYGMKALARELHCPIVCLSQLSRAPDGRPDHHPMLADLRESGSIEQDADLVMFLYRADYYNKESETPGTAECIISKQRNGPVGTIPLAWIGKFSKFGIADTIHGV